MATTPHAPPPKQQTNDEKNKAHEHEREEHEAKAHSKAAPEKRAAKEEPQYPTLAPGAAWPLFFNGHRVAKQGDPVDKWISMGRTGDGIPVVTSPMTKEIEDAVKSGEYYLAEGEPPPKAAAGPPTNVDVPYVEAMGQAASCTMGNWNGEPTSYGYAWQRAGVPISGATAADYTMVAADSGKAVGCIVTATNAAGSTAAPLSNTITAP